MAENTSISNSQTAPAERRSRRRGGRRDGRRRGSSLIEFTLLGIPVIFLMTSVIAASLDMWQFFTLSYATEITARYAGMHGNTCESPNSCTVTLGTVVGFFEKQSIALNSALVVVTFTDGSGTTTCNPITTCAASSATSPNTSYNNVGSNITVAATYKLIDPIAMLWPGSHGVSGGTFLVGATSTLPILY